MTSSPYDTFIKITLIDSFTPGLGIIAAGLNKLQKHFDTMTAAQKAMTAGLTGVAGGVLGVVAAFKEFGPAGEKLLDQQQQMVNKGIDLNNVLRIQAEYFKNVARSVPTISAVEYLKQYQDLRGVLGTDAAAAIAAPQASKIDALLGDKSAYDIYRGIERKGAATDPAEQQRIIDATYPYFQLFKEKIKPSDFSTFTKRAGAAWINADIAKTVAPYFVATADLGGDTAGTSAMSLYQLQQGTMTLSKQQGEMFNKLGLLDMNKIKMTGFGGSKMQMEPGAMKGSIDYAHDLPGWVREVIWPAVMKAANGDMSIASSMLGKMAPNRNAQRMMYMWGSDEFNDQINKDKALAGRVPNLNTAYNNATTDNPIVVMKAFWAQLDSFKEAVGAPMVQQTIPFIRSLTGAISSLGEAANNHPRLATSLVLGGGGALGGALAGGTLGMMGGPLGMAGGAVIGAGVGLAAANWDKIQKVNWAGIAAGFESIASPLLKADWGKILGNDIADLVSGINNLMTSLGVKIVDGFSRLPNMFTLSFDWLGAKIIAAWNALAGSIPYIGNSLKIGSTTQPSAQVNPAAIMPPAKSDTVNIAASFNIDGRQLSRIVASHMVDAAIYPTGATQDGRNLWQSPLSYPEQQ